MKLLRGILMLLLGSLLAGLLIGTLIRLRLEQPTVYFVGRATIPLDGAATRRPGDIGNACPTVLDAGHHEEQIG
jgi:hypothetical protein